MKQLFLLVIIFLTLCVHSSFAQQSAGSKSFKEKFIHLKTGIKLEYVEQGNANGVPIIFLHGLSDSWHSFESVLPNLPSSIHAFAISQRGHGDSERPADGYSTHDFASDIASFIKQKNLGPVIIAGHSMGGANAQQFALNYPHLTRALVIIDSDCSFTDNPGMPEFYQQSMQLQSIDKTFMDEFQKSTLANPIDAAYYDLLVIEGLKVPASVFKAALTAMMTVDFTNELKNITAPVLIFWGDKDSFCQRKDQDQLMKSIPHAKFMEYKNTGHALHWEDPVRFANDLSAFAEEVKNKE
jgi:pimeloyl-ACP methyl ester carboxylesterase